MRLSAVGRAPSRGQAVSTPPAAEGWHHRNRSAHLLAPPGRAAEAAWVMTVLPLEAPDEVARRRRRASAPGCTVSHRSTPSAGVHRTRLLHALGGPEGRPFVVVIGPAGYGKTTLLRDWCAQDPRP